MIIESKRYNVKLLFFFSFPPAGGRCYRIVQEDSKKEPRQMPGFLR